MGQTLFPRFFEIHGRKISQIQNEAAPTAGFQKLQSSLFLSVNHNPMILNSRHSRTRDRRRNSLRKIFEEILLGEFVVEFLKELLYEIP